MFQGKIIGGPSIQQHFSEIGRVLDCRPPHILVTFVGL